jgi:hypothetical protein
MKDQRVNRFDTASLAVSRMFGVRLWFWLRHWDQLSSFPEEFVARPIRFLVAVGQLENAFEVSEQHLGLPKMHSRDRERPPKRY